MFIRLVNFIYPFLLGRIMTNHGICQEVLEFLALTRSPRPDSDMNEPQRSDNSAEANSTRK